MRKGCDLTAREIIYKQTRKSFYKRVVILFAIALFLFHGNSLRAEPYSRLFVVQFKSDQVKRYLGCRISDLRVASYQGSELVSIPFQVDRVNEKGEYSFPGDLEFNRNSLAAKDEFVIQGDDFGKRAPGDVLAKLGDVLEIKVEKENQTAYAYLGLLDIPLSEEDYISYDPLTNRIQTPFYTLAGHPHNSSFYSEVIIGGVDFIDRAKLRATATLFFGKIKLTRTEEDIVGVHAGAVDGPVRVLRKIHYRVRIVGDIQSPTLTRITKSYKAVNDLPNNLSVPFNLDYVFTDLGGVAAFDFSPQIKGAKIYCSTCGEGFVVNGKMDSFERHDTGQGSRNFSLCAEAGTVIMAVRLSGLVEELPIETKGVFTDDMNEMDPPEDVPGKFGMFGYQLTNLHKVPKGKYEFHAYLLFPEKCPGKGGSKKEADRYLGPYKLQFSNLNQ